MNLKCSHKKSNHRTQHHLLSQTHTMIENTVLFLILLNWLNNKIEFYELLLFRCTMYNFEIKCIKQKICVSVYVLLQYLKSIGNLCN